MRSVSLIICGAFSTWSRLLGKFHECLSFCIFIPTHSSLERVRVLRIQTLYLQPTRMWSVRPVIHEASSIQVRQLGKFYIFRALIMSICADLTQKL